ncbi:MAG: DNA gyrase subunit A [Christensenellales bacterium]
MDRRELEEILDKIDASKILDIKVKEELEKSFIAYAMAVNVSRAIPDVRDGLKPVHRRIIYAMGNNLGLYNDKPFRKSATIVGEVMGKFHPHGDSAIYDALVRLAQDFTINCPLVEGHGNFGSVDGDPPAAARYTEARLSKIAAEMLNGINQETVDFYPNFDGREMQPTVLPSRFPNLLVNGSDGIAVGMATNVPPHNLCEVINGVIALIDNPDITIDELMQYIPAPDFPTKGIVIGSKGIKEMYTTGKGTFTLRAKTEIEEENDRFKIVITEIPYQVNKAKLIMQIADMVKSKRIEGISDIREESDREGMRIVIDVKRDANAQVVLNNLFKHTQLQISFGAINLALVDGTPKVLPLKDILVHYLNFQKDVITRRTKFELDKAEARAHILRGLVIAQENIDEVIRQIKLSSDKQDAVDRLTRLFKLDEKQANAILDMRLQKLTGLEVEKLKAELEEVERLIKEYKEILGSELRILEIIKGDLIEIKNKYGVPRKTEISYDYSSLDIGDLIPRETVVLSLTHGGYIKRMPVSEYKAQHRGGVGVVGHKTKEEDFVEDIFITSSHDDLLCFSTKGRVYKLKAYEVPEATRTSKGRAMVNLLQLDKDEAITTIIPVKPDDEGYLMMATKQGLIKKTRLDEFTSIRKGGKIAIKLNENDVLIGVRLTKSNDEILLASSEGKCIRFNEHSVRALGRDTLGVKSMKMSSGEEIVSMTVIVPNADMLTVSEYGYGKRTNENEYRVQGRNGKGIKAGIFNEVTGKLVNLKQVTEDDDVMLIADDGVIIRVSASEISKISRNTKGVKIMNLKKNSKIVCLAVTKSDKGEEKMAEELVEEEPQSVVNENDLVKDDIEEQPQIIEDDELL